MSTTTHQQRVFPMLIAFSAVTLTVSFVSSFRNALADPSDYTVGLETNADLRDLRRMETLALGGRYCAAVVPQGWVIAVTEMDTFGFFSDHEILDLWGFTNRDIALSHRLGTPHKIKVNPSVFLKSNVPIFWVRTFKYTATNCYLYDPTDIAYTSPANLPSALAHFPILSKQWNTVGDLGAVLKRYDVVRVYHGSRYQFATVFLVRKDVTNVFRAHLIQRGHILRSSAIFDMHAFDTAYNS